MMSSSNSRQLAWQLIKAALQAVDPALAVKNYFSQHPEVAAQIRETRGRVVVVGAGKAGTPMATAVTELFGDKIVEGQVIVKYGHTGQTPGDHPLRIKIKEAGHPVPDEAGLRATQEIAELLNQTGPDDTVICLLSGGGSA